MNLLRLFLAALTTSAFLLAASDGLHIGSTVPDLVSTDCYGRGFSMQFHRGKVVLLSIDRLRDPEITDQQKQELKAFYDARRDKGLEIVRIGYKKNIPFFITKSYVEKRAREALEAAHTHSIFIVDWDNALHDQITPSTDPLFFVIDKHGVVREEHPGWLVLTDELARRVDGLMGVN